MRLQELALLYFLLGLGSALVALLSPSQRRLSRSRRAVDAVLMLLWWPLYAPFVFAASGILSVEQKSQSGAQNLAASGDLAEGHQAFIQALNAARQTPLAPLLPDPETVRALATRLQVVQAKLGEIDLLLRRQDFDEAQASARMAELEHKGASPYARSLAGIRMQNIQHMKRLRRRFALELDEIDEMLAQLRTQADVVRLAGRVETDSQDLVQELLLRVESLDSMLAAEFDSAQAEVWT